jgi:DNA-binding transcriptional ArsR family regulator
MVVDEVERQALDAVFHALADSTRRDIVVRTLQDEYSVSALSRLYPMTFAAVQKHVAVLDRAALVTKRRSGREQLVTGNVDTVRRAARLLDQLELVWRARMDRFGDILAEDPSPVDPSPVDPSPVDPSPVDPSPVDPSPGAPA